MGAKNKELLMFIYIFFNIYYYHETLYNSYGWEEHTKQIEV